METASNPIVADSGKSVWGSAIRRLATDGKGIYPLARGVRFPMPEQIGRYLANLIASTRGHAPLSKARCGWQPERRWTAGRDRHL